MRIRQWQLTQRHRWVETLILLFVVLGSLPTQLTILPPFFDSLLDDNVVKGGILEKSEAFVAVPRLMGTMTHFSNTGFDSDLDFTLVSQGNHLTPNFAIGQQAGTGGGSYNVYDSFNWTGTETIDTQNSIDSGTSLPTDREDSISITNPSGFTKQYQYFNISNVEANYDWRLIEDVGAYTTTFDSDLIAGQTHSWMTIAISFEIKEDYVNLSDIQTYTKVGGIGAHTGEIWIERMNATGYPNGTAISEVQSLGPWTGWNQYSFTPITLSKGEYFVIMNDTDTGSSKFWTWYATNDAPPPNGDGENINTIFRKRPDYDSDWQEYWDLDGYYDAPLQIRVTPVEADGSVKKYSLGSDVKIWYNTSANGGSEVFLDSTSWFKGNDTTTHNFKSNTSVSFTLSFVANYTCASYPFSATSSYLVSNETVTNWNLTFSTAALNTTYSIRNHTIRISGMESDWDGAYIYWNDSSSPEYTNLDDNVNVTLDGDSANKYVNGSSIMVINASTLVENTTWDIWLEAPNYINSFNWQISNNNVTTANTMDILEANYTFMAPNIGGRNFSIWIEAPDGTLVNSSVDNTFGTNDLYNWDINQSIHNALLTDKANGTYQTYAFWENTTNNQVGFYTRNITVFIHTTLLVEAPDEVLENTWLNMTIHYNATHIETGVNNGNVTGLFGWNDTSETFNQPIAFGLYNLSIWIDGSDHAPGDKTNITIYAELPWYQNHTEIWNITVVSVTTLAPIDAPANLILEYGQTYLLQVNYLYNGSFLPEANMTVDGDSENYTEETDRYSYLLDTRNYNSSESYSNLEIRLNRSGYLTQKLTFNLTVTAGPTTLHKAYTPAIPSIYYTESYSFAVFYNNTVDNEGITNADNSTSHSSVIKSWYSNSSGYYFFNLSSSSLSLGSLEINITLNHPVYQENYILLTFNIVKMPTQPLDSYDISSNQILVEDTITVTIDEYLTYKSETIGPIDNASILLNDSSVDHSLVSFSSNAPFSIVLDTTGIQYGKYNMTIILSVYGYESQTISFNVSIDGYETEISVEIEPGTNIQQGEDIIFIATLAYGSEGGAGAGITQQVPLGGVTINFYVVLEYENGTTQIYEGIRQTDDLNYQATYIIDGIYTRDAIKFTNITIYSSPSLSGLPYTYNMSANELETYKILPLAIDIFEVITNVLLIVVAVLISASIAVTTIRVFRRRRRVRKQLILRHDIAIEQGFEDIKSIRLILARHQSGLQFYAEKTIAELQADTDALSGMSAAMSSFLEELSESMSSQSDTEQIHRKDKIEVMSREGLHMLIWHGIHSSLIIISEARLPDYFQSRLKTLGHELEGKFIDELKDFYSSDQIPSTVVKKMVRKYIPLHYFCAFVLNEGVLTLDSIKLDKKESKMLKSIKNIMFNIEGMNYFFSEQIISHLSQKYKRSEAIKFLDRAIELNLLIEAEQDDLLRISRG